MNQDILRVLPWIQNVPDLGVDAYIATMKGPISFLGMKNLSEGYAEVLESNKTLTSQLRSRDAEIQALKAGEKVNVDKLAKFVSTVSGAIEPPKMQEIAGNLGISSQDADSEDKFKGEVMKFLGIGD